MITVITEHIAPVSLSVILQNTLTSQLLSTVCHGLTRLSASTLSPQSLSSVCNPVAHRGEGETETSQEGCYCWPSWIINHKPAKFDTMQQKHSGPLSFFPRNPDIAEDRGKLSH
ncbi:uncharacterized protein LOC144580163 [Callithrix jacchus]